MQEYARITMLVVLHIKLVKIKRKNFPVDGLFSVECPVRKITGKKPRVQDLVLIDHHNENFYHMLTCCKGYEYAMHVIQKYSSMQAFSLGKEAPKGLLNMDQVKALVVVFCFMSS